jgi:Zn-dependent peptidase ImmA (M78 family)
LLEMELGVRVYVRRLPSEISGLMAYDDALGACIMLNASHRRDRRAQTGAHEMGHLGNRREAEVLEANATENTREEKYASAFGRGFLTPAHAVMQKFKEVTAGWGRLSRRHVIILANFFGVSREAMVRRLEELELVKPGAWDWFEKNGSITDEQERQVLGDLGLADARKAEADRPTTLRLNLLANAASRHGLMSEGQLARLLRLDRVELREILDGADAAGEDDGAPQLLA